MSISPFVSVIRGRIISSCLLLFAYSLMAGLPACVAFPLEIGDPEPFTDENLAFIEIGKSTKGDIAAVMSNYSVTTDDGMQRVKLKPKQFRDGDWWLYVQARGETKWFVAAVEPFGDAHADVTGDLDYRFLLIKFDRSGIVQAYEVSSSEGMGCNRQGVCALKNQFMLLAPPDDDRLAKQYEVPADRCGVYVYGKTQHATSLSIDGRWLGQLISPSTYFYLPLEAGNHQLAIGYPVKFSCAAGESHFFEIKPEKSGVFHAGGRLEIRIPEPAAARKAIGRRKLLLTVSDAIR